jgi:hypothetical protein
MKLGALLHDQLISPSLALSRYPGGGIPIILTACYVGSGALLQDSYVQKLSRAAGATVYATGSTTWIDRPNANGDTWVYAAGKLSDTQADMSRMGSFEAIGDPGLRRPFGDRITSMAFHKNGTVTVNYEIDHTVADPETGTRLRTTTPHSVTVCSTKGSCRR